MSVWHLVGAWHAANKETAVPLTMRWRVSRRRGSSGAAEAITAKSVADGGGEAARAGREAAV